MWNQNGKFVCICGWEPRATVGARNEYIFAFLFYAANEIDFQKEQSSLVWSQMWIFFSWKLFANPLNQILRYLFCPAQSVGTPPWYVNYIIIFFYTKLVWYSVNSIATKMNCLYIFRKHIFLLTMWKKKSVFHGRWTRHIVLISLIHAFMFSFQVLTCPWPKEELLPRKICFLFWYCAPSREFI